MVGKNWNSKPKTWTDVVKASTKAKASRATSLRARGESVAKIAGIMKLSKSRIYELLKR